MPFFYHYLEMLYNRHCKGHMDEAKYTRLANKLEQWNRNPRGRITW